MANTLRSHRKGAVGFIEWLDVLRSTKSALSKNPFPTDIETHSKKPPLCPTYDDGNECEHFGRESYIEVIDEAREQVEHGINEKYPEPNQTTPEVRTRDPHCVDHYDQ